MPGPWTRHTKLPDVVHVSGPANLLLLIDTDRSSAREIIQTKESIHLHFRERKSRATDPIYVLR